MPECIVLAKDLQQAYEWQLQVENLGEAWRCEAYTAAEEAYQRLWQRPCQVAVTLAPLQAERLTELLQARPPLAPPWLLTAWPQPGTDGWIAEAEALPALLKAWQEAGRLPLLAQGRHGQVVCLARGLMSMLKVPRRLRAWQFLPDMAALCTVHPPLMEDLRGRLYPLVGRRYGMTAAAVERSLRLAIESTWSGASLPALERFFGHRVDPERGKPTNREFLCRVQERLTLAAGRIA